MEKNQKNLKVIKGRKESEVLERNFVIITLNNVDKAYLEETRELFSPLYKRVLTDEECIEIINNMINAELLLKNIGGRR